MPDASAVVTGAGPAGAATALLLARAGVRVTLLDRESFPRDKACGGGLTPRGVSALGRLGIDTSGPAFVAVGGIEMIGYGRSSAVPFPATSRYEPRGVVVRRRDVDAMLLDNAIAAGAEFRPGARVIGPVVEHGVCRGVRLASQEDVRADVTIAADGATSAVARGAGLAAPSASGGGFWYAAMRSYVGPVAPHTRDGRGVLEFYPLRTPDGRWLPGYGWVFPLPGDTANVGVDLPHRPPLAGAPPLRAAYNAFLERLRRDRPGFEGAIEEQPPVGALLPEGLSGTVPAMPGLLAVGDSCSLITPYSGEGIVYALESAELAAAAFLRGGSPRTVACEYRDTLVRAYRFHFAWALAFMKGVRRPGLARLAAWAVLGRPRVLRAAVRVMANLIEDDPSASPSTVSRAYLAASRWVPSPPSAGVRAAHADL